MLTQEKQETRFPFLGQEGTLKEEMGTHSSILAWNIPWKEEPDGLQSGASQSQTPLSRHTHTHTQTHLSAVKVLSPNHWTAREFLESCTLNGRVIAQ